MAIIGAHALLYSSQSDSLRAMLRDVFGFKHVDAGGGWLIFTLPPAELGIHPFEGHMNESGAPHKLSFMCSDIHTTINELLAKGVSVSGEPKDQGFGITVNLNLPGGSEVMLYEPRHPVALDTRASVLPRALVTLLSEALNGPGTNAFFLNPGDRGLLAVARRVVCGNGKRPAKWPLVGRLTRRSPALRLEPAESRGTRRDVREGQLGGKLDAAACHGRPMENATRLACH